MTVHRRRSVTSCRVRAVVSAAGRGLRRAERPLRPGRRAWNGAAGGLVAGTAVAFVVMAFHSALRPTPSWGRVLGFGWTVGTALAAGAGAWLGFLALRRVPPRYRIALLLTAPLLIPVAGGLGDGPVSAVFYVVAWSLAGAGIAVVASGATGGMSGLRRAIAIVGLVVGIAGIAATFVYLADDGMPALEVRHAAAEADLQPETIAAADPGAPGPFAVRTLTYGSGEGPRHEFGRDVDLITESVDGSDLVDNWEGWSGWARERYWGFDVEALPLQGRVWHPDGDGPFPLVLTVHGNHSMDDYSDPGYAYLGEMLASRGYVFVSVDENFINGFAGDRLSGGLREENDARGWLLLEHLRVWRAWSQETGNPFEGRVDLDRIGLIGHSRGGEAVAVAAAFNELPFYPDDATVAFDYGFGIGAVVAIAPVYGQYRPAGLYTPLRDVNYLVLHGANDADVSSFSGAGQYEAVELSGGPYRFKSAVYVYGANHGQFNSTWGDTDWGAPFSARLNTEALMPGEDQRQAARVFIGAFLEAALRGAHEYLPIFTDPRRARHWLPDTVYVADFRDSRFRTVADFDEDIDVTTTTLPGARIETRGLTRWREDRVALKWGDKKTNAAYVGWQRADDAGSDRETETETGSDQPAATETPVWAIRLEAGHDASDARALVLSLADADESPAPKDDDDNDDDAHVSNTDDEDEASDDGDAPREPIDLTVRLTDLDGRVADVPLSRFAAVQAQLEVQTAKGVFGDAERSSEPVYQTFELPIEWFLAVEPALDAARLASIELRFDRSPEGVLIIDDVGFAPR